MESKGDCSHQGITLTADGSVSLQLSSKSVGVFEAFYNSVKVRFLFELDRSVFEFDCFISEVGTLFLCNLLFRCVYGCYVPMRDEVFIGNDWCNISFLS